MLKNKVYDEHKHYAFLPDGNTKLLSHVLANIFPLLCDLDQSEQADESDYLVQFRYSRETSKLSCTSTPEAHKKQVVGYC